MSTATSTLASAAEAAVLAKAAKDVADAKYRAAVEALAEQVDNEPGTYNVKGFVFNVAENNTYDAAEMEAALKTGQVQRCSKRVLDKAVVKRLYPEVYNAAKRTNGVKVTLR